MTERTPEEFATHLRRLLNHSTDVETHAMIITIWLVGVTQRLANLGVIRGGEMKEIAGMDQWPEIDKLRYMLIPPRVLGHCLVSFTKAAAIGPLQERLAELIAMYYTETGREEITTKSLDRIFLNSPGK